MGVTIKDVAKLAKVSPSTVSRVIADHPRISQDTKERVRSIMNDLGYHPNAIARSLVNKTSNTLGVIISRSTEQAFINPFFPEVIRGISSIANKHNLSLLLSTSSERIKEEEECLNMLRQRRVDGVVLLASHKEDSLIPQLAKEQFPFVLIGRYDGEEEVSWVNNDNIQAAYQAVEFLISKGHKRIACLDGDPDMIVSFDRYTGYVQAMQTANIPIRQELVEHSEFSQVGGYQATLRLLDAKKDFTAIFAVDDLLALGALRALNERNLRVGKDIGLIGFNNTILGACIDPPLTTVHVPIYELGRTAVQLLIAQIKGSAPRGDHQTLPAELIVRKSC